MKRKKYRKREQQLVIAVQINLDTGGFEYHKWGGVQRCKSGDWLVNNNGDVYTVNEESFARTYQEIEPGKFKKITSVWASQADEDGKVKSNEGFTDFKAGDYIVHNNEDGTDAYAVSKCDFEAMYEESAA